MADRTAGAVVHGRESEFAAVAAFVSGADSGALVLVGDPGIGKTTLWRAGVAEARRRGVRVLASTPGSSETRLSFATLADLLAGTFAEVGDRLPRPQRRALDVALVLEERSDGAEQRTVAAATLSTLQLMANDQPLLLAIDDMQWMDGPSNEALAFAVRRLGTARIAVLGTRRIQPASAERTALEDALDYRHGVDLKHMHVAPLSLNSLHAVIRDSVGVTFPHGVMERLHSTSGGNPMYALELARALTRRAQPIVPGVPLPVPESLQSLLGQRLGALSEPVQALLAAVAALASPTLATIEALGMAGAFDEAIATGVLEQLEFGHLRFTHPLLASAASAALAPQARRDLHARLAGLVGGEERARHLALAATGPSASVAAILQQAARQAAGRGAIATAAELAEQAIQLTPRERIDDLHERQLEAARYEIPHGDIERARGHLEPLLRELPPGPMRAGVLLQLARFHEQEALTALRLCLQAIDEAGPNDVRAAEAHQHAAEEAMLTGDIPSALEHARLAVQVAERVGDRAMLIESLGTLCHYQTYTGLVEAGLLERAVELERQQPRPSNNYSPREILGLRLMYADRLDEARELLEASYATAVDIGDELDRGAVLIHLTQLECRAGRLAAADHHARECAINREQTGLAIPGARFATALVGAHLGRVEQARADGAEGAALAGAGGNEVFRVLNLWAVGLLELSRDDAVAADSYLRDLPRAVDAMGYRNPGVRPIHADAIEARIGAGDLDVEALIGDLEQRGQAFDSAWALAAAARCRGQMLGALGKMEAAIGQFQKALGHHQRSPQPLERARTLLALGSALRRAKRRREARAVLTQSLEVFDILGTPMWAERAAAELARIPGRTASSGKLSGTERRVAELVADGLSNKEVAARLFVSVRTVESNLSSVYAKLGVRSRSELGRRLGHGDPG